MAPHTGLEPTTSAGRRTHARGCPDGASPPHRPHVLGTPARQFWVVYPKISRNKGLSATVWVNRPKPASACAPPATFTPPPWTTPPALPPVPRDGVSQVGLVDAVGMLPHVVAMRHPGPGASPANGLGCPGSARSRRCPRALPPARSRTVRYRLSFSGQEQGRTCPRALRPRKAPGSRSAMGSSGHPENAERRRPPSEAQSPAPRAGSDARGFAEDRGEPAPGGESGSRSHRGQA